MNKTNTNKLNQEHFELLKCILKEPNISQRGLSIVLGLSLGKLNYSIKQLSNINLIKINKEENKNNKRKFLYTVTPVSYTHLTLPTTPYV